jgi:Uma2 family endonuclease
MITWKDLCEDPSLEDLPYKIELTKDGTIEMSPTRTRHAIYQSRIDTLLHELMRRGQMLVEVAVMTADNVKVADVAWASDERTRIISDELSCSIAPEICVEVWSPSNTRKKMDKKKKLYLGAGALEFWYCDKDGNISFFDADGERERSKLCPKFPRSVG